MGRFKALLVFGFLSIQLLALPAYAQVRTGNIDMVLIMDLSGSMSGEGGALNIFGRVQETAKDIVSTLHRGDTFTLITFGVGVQVYPTVTRLDASQRGRIFTLIDGLRADQAWTYTSAALAAGLRVAKGLDSTFKGHKKLIFILTDGINDPPPWARKKALTLQDVARPYANAGWYVYQVQYGERVDTNLTHAAQIVGHGGSISDRGVQGGIDSLRPIINEIHSISQGWRTHVKKFVLQLDTLGQTAKASTNIGLPTGLSTRDVLVRAETARLPKGIEISTALVSEGGTNYQLQVNATARKSVPNGQYIGTLLLQPRDTAQVPLAINFVIDTKLMRPLWPFYLVGIIITIIVLLSIYAVLKWRRRYILSGSLEYWQENTLEHHTIDDLSTFGRKLVLSQQHLSLEFPGGGSLGTLNVQKSDEGEYLVHVEPAGNHHLEFKGEEVPGLPLYDGDQFKIDNHAFRYSGSTSSRP